MIWKERRLEFAGEGDRWYDFVRRAYYDVNACINELKSQHRNQLWNCDALYKAYYQSAAFGRILNYLQANPLRCKLREVRGKHSMLISDVPTVQEAVAILGGITQLQSV